MGVITLNRREAASDLAHNIPLLPDTVDLVPLSNADSRGIIALLLIFTILAWVAVGLRFYTRTKFLRLTWDDWLMLIAIGVFTGMGAMIISVYSVLYDRREADIKTMAHVTNMLLITECLYTWAMLVFKFSLILFFRPLMKLRWQKITLIVVIVVNVVIGLAHFFLTVFQCGTPGGGDSVFARKFTGQCVSVGVVLGIGLPHAIVNGVTDVILVAMPIHLVWHTKIKHKEKWILSFIFALAAGLLSLIRCGFIRELVAKGPTLWPDSQGFIITSSLELAIAIISASLATLRPLYRQTAKVIRSYVSASRSTKNNTSTRASDPEKGQHHGITREESGSSADDWNNKGVLLSATNEDAEKENFSSVPGQARLLSLPSNNSNDWQSLMRTMDTKLRETGMATHGSFSPLNTEQHEQTYDDRVPLSRVAPPAEAVVRPERPTNNRQNTDVSVGSSWRNMGGFLDLARGRSAKQSVHGSESSKKRRKPGREDSSRSGPIQLGGGFQKWVIRK